MKNWMASARISGVSGAKSAAKGGFKGRAKKNVPSIWDRLLGIEVQPKEAGKEENMEEEKSGSDPNDEKDDKDDGGGGGDDDDDKDDDKEAEGPKVKIGKESGAPKAHTQSLASAKREVHSKQKICTHKHTEPKITRARYVQLMSSYAKHQGKNYLYSEEPYILIDERLYCEACQHQVAWNNRRKHIFSKKHNDAKKSVVQDPSQGPGRFGSATRAGVGNSDGTFQG